MRNILEINELSKTYENGFSALSNTSLNVKEGEIHCATGAERRGKDNTYFDDLWHLCTNIRSDQSRWF